MWGKWNIFQHFIPDLCAFPGSISESLQEWYALIISGNISLRSIMQSVGKVTIYLGETAKSVCWSDVSYAPLATYPSNIIRPQDPNHRDHVCLQY